MNRRPRVNRRKRAFDPLWVELAESEDVPLDEIDDRAHWYVQRSCALADWVPMRKNLRRLAWARPAEFRVLVAVVEELARRAYCAEQ